MKNCEFSALHMRTQTPRTREPGGCSPWGHEESDMTEQLHFHFSFSCIGEGNGNPLQHSCLENPTDRGAWRATPHGVAESNTTEQQPLRTLGGSGPGFLTVKAWKQRSTWQGRETRVSARRRSPRAQNLNGVEKAE